MNKYNLEISVSIGSADGFASNFMLRTTEKIELRNIGEAGELLVRIHQLIRSVQDKKAV